MYIAIGTARSRGTIGNDNNNVEKIYQRVMNMITNIVMMVMVKITVTMRTLVK